MEDGHPSTRTKRLSKKLSWLLRHGATEAGLPMDAAGWVAVADVLRIIEIDDATLDELIRTNRKQRLQRTGDRVRACQGHSDGVPVTREALEASWTRYTAERAWHGTHVDAIEGIAERGISARARTHVHLAAELDSVVGKRANVHVMLGVSIPALRERGLDAFEAPNGVVLVREVPTECIVELRAQTKRARAREAELRGMFGL